jgi:hypothetical protein
VPDNARVLATVKLGLDIHCKMHGFETDSMTHEHGETMPINTSAPNLIIEEERVGHATCFGGEHGLFQKRRIRVRDWADAAENRLLGKKTGAIISEQAALKREQHAKTIANAYQSRILVRRSEVDEKLRIGGGKGRLPRRAAVVTHVVGAEIEQHCVRSELRIIVERARVADDRAPVVMCSKGRVAILQTE